MSRKPKAAYVTAARFSSDAPASPAKVLALAKLVEEGLTAILGRKPLDAEFTLVVSNQSMDAALRAYSSLAASAGKKLEKITSDPTKVRDLPSRSRAHLARSLRQGYETFHDDNLIVQNARRTRSTSVDDVLIGALKGIEASATSIRTMRGTNESITPVFGVSRKSDEPGKLLARIRVDGVLCDVPLAHEAIDPAIESVKRCLEVRAELEVVWRATDGENFTIVASESLVSKIEPLLQVLDAKTWLPELAELIGPDAAEEATRLAYEVRGLDWKDLQ